MKVLVTEIGKDTLTEYIELFGLYGQITFLNELEIPNKDEKYDCVWEIIDQPYYIEEKIEDLDNLLSFCDDVDYCREPLWKAIKKKIVWDKFFRFYELILNIKKQRDFGTPLSDIEYVYKKGLQHDLSIELRSSRDLGFDPNVDYLVITGQSNFGKMMLYQENGCTEFVFSIEYNKNNLLPKRKLKYNGTHWHPRKCFEAIKDMIAFMTNDNDYLLRFGFVKYFL